MKRVGCIGIVAVACGCAASPAMSAAQRGDLGALRETIAARERAGEMTNSEAARLALATLERDVRAAPAAAAVDRVHDARPCAHEIDGVLEERMRVHDAAGAEAAIARIDAGTLDLDGARGWNDDADARWRAVSARALVRPEDRAARLRALVSASPEVRRMAARAARDAADAGDLAPLAEAARVDPEPIVRTEAVRAIASLPPTPSGAVANVLRDLWTAGDDGLREDIAVAWAGDAVWSAGGREALRVVVSSEHGPGAVEAASAVLRRRDIDAEVAAAAAAHLVRAIESGLRRARLQAIAEAPVGRADVASAIRKSADSDDLEVRTASLARMAELRDARAAADLVALAQPGSPVASRARFALAGTGSARAIQAWVEQDLAAPRAEDRLDAAAVLAVQGMAGRAAPLLADSDAAVRDRAACTIVAAARVVR